MKFREKPRLFRYFTVTFAVLAFFVLADRPAHAGSEHNIAGYAWSATIGWISMNCTNEGTCATSNYGVTIDDTTGVTKLIGYAWSSTVGWVCFGETCPGNAPDTQPAWARYEPVVNGKFDQLIGWAQILNLGDAGWFSLNCETAGNCATSNYQMVVNTADGRFTKDAANDHWAWGGNDEGTGIGWVDFSIVTTDWTPAGLGRVIRPDGIYEPENPTLPGTHLDTFRIRFANYSAPKAYFLECDVELPDASSRVLSKVMSDTVRNGVESLEYTVQASDFIDDQERWFITGCRIAAPPSTTVCSSDPDCVAMNGLCDEGIGLCRVLIDSRSMKKPIFTHGNIWTGLDSDQDQYKAIKCYSGFPGRYFKSAKQCDFTGDASFSLVMRRGVELEGDCSDGIDNDGNGDIDCDDRYCQGVSYFCQQHRPAVCVWGQSGDGIEDCTDGGYLIGDLCCARQPISEATPNLYNIVDGLECTYGEPNDGYFDCDCTSAAAFNASGTDDCFAPGYQNDDLCCTADDDVIKIPSAG